MDFLKNMNNITKRKIILTIIIAGIIALLILFVIKTVNSFGNYLYLITLAAPLFSFLFIKLYPDRKILGQGEPSGGGLWDFFFGEGPRDPMVVAYEALPPGHRGPPPK